MDRATFNRVLKRILHEFGRSILYGTAIKGLESADTAHAVDFIRLAKWALFNDCVACAMRSFDRTRRAASFWYLERLEPTEVSHAANSVGLSIAEVESLASSLQSIRNKTHFHIDKVDVFDPNKVWREANITGAQFDHVLQMTFEALNCLYRTREGEDFLLPTYDAADARAIAKFVESLSLGTN